MPDNDHNHSTRGLFVAVGHKGQRIISEDGANWTHLQTGKDGEVYRAVVGGNGRFVAIGSYGGQNIFAASADGVEWKLGQKDARYSVYLRSIGYGADKFLALGGDPGGVGDSKPFVMTTADGITWSDYTPIAGKNILRQFAYGNGLYIGVGDRGRRAASKDGIDWKDAPDVKAIDTLISVGYGNGVFVGVGLNALRMTTTDGIAWSHRQIGEEGEHINSVLWAKDQFIGVGLGGTYFSPDGISWTRKENHDAPLFATWGNGVFVGVQWKGRLMRSDDAVNWKQVYKADEHLEAVTWGDVG